MSCEIDFITSNELFEMDRQEIIFPYENRDLHKAIFSPRFNTCILLQKNIMPLKIGGNIEVKVEASWGGKEKPEVSVGASGEIYDDHGNYAKGEVKQNSEGEGKISVSAGHKEE